MHGIEEFDDGTASFYSARQPAWHRLGTVTDEAKTAREALELAQLDWEVRLAPLYAHDGDVMVKVDGSQAVVRTHGKRGRLEALGVVRMRYTPVQNVEAFDLLTAIVAQSDLRFETAGSIFGGARVFVSARLPEGIRVAGHDEMNLYLLATNNHDGRAALRIAVTPVRVVCQNTLALGLKRSRSMIKARHTGVPTERLADDARQALGLIRDFSAELKVEAERLLATSMSEDDFAGYARRFMDQRIFGGREVTEVTRSRYLNELMKLWNGPTQAPIASTQWAAYNAVVEWLDWIRPVRNSDTGIQRGRRALGGDDLRAQQVINGDKEADKLAAFEMLAAI